MLLLSLLLRQNLSCKMLQFVPQLSRATLSTVKNCFLDMIFRWTVHHFIAATSVTSMTQILTNIHHML